MPILAVWPKIAFTFALTCPMTRADPACTSLSRRLRNSSTFCFSPDSVLPCTPSTLPRYRFGGVSDHLEDGCEDVGEVFFELRACLL